MKPILMDNAFEAWAAAIRYCNDIKDGKATLQYQKNFVSSLHNAVELINPLSIKFAVMRSSMVYSMVNTYIYNLTKNNECEPIFDNCMSLTTTYSRPWAIGYLMLHKSGHILYFPAKDSTYCIDLGLGYQPTAYTDYTREKFIWYYTFNGNVYRNILQKNSETNIIEEAPYTRTFSNTINLQECIPSMSYYSRSTASDWSYHNF